MRQTRVAGGNLRANSLRAAAKIAGNRRKSRIFEVVHADSPQKAGFSVLRVVKRR